MIDEARQALESCQAELRQLDRRLAEADADAVEPLTVATTLVELEKLRAKVVRLSSHLLPPVPPPAPDAGPGLFDPPAPPPPPPTNDAAEPRGRGRRRPAGR